MDLNKIQNRNYTATVKRGLITPLTTVNDFFQKIKEEIDEWYEIAFLENSEGNEGHELADIIIVCLNAAKHRGIDIQKALEEKTLINETRKD